MKGQFKRALTILIFVSIGSMLIFATVLDSIFTFQSVNEYVSKIEFEKVHNGVYRDSIFSVVLFTFVKSGSDPIVTDGCNCSHHSFDDVSYSQDCNWVNFEVLNQKVRKAGDRELMKIRFDHLHSWTKVSLIINIFRFWIQLRDIK